MAATSFAGSLDCSDSQAIVAGNYLVNHRNCRAGMLGNFRRFSWSNQRVVDNEPALPTPRTWVQFKARFDLFCREMRGSSRDSCHRALLKTCTTNLSPHSLILFS